MEIGLILDVEGVIVDTETVNVEASVEVFRTLGGVSVRPDDFRPFIGAGAERYISGVAEKYGVRMNLREAVERREAGFLRIAARKGLNPFAGALDLIHDAARAPDFRTAVATSATPTKAFVALNAVGLTERDFDAVITAADLTRGKPHPEIHLLAAERLDLPAAQCVVVEDAPAGIHAARKAGAASIAVTNTARPEMLRRADRIVTSLTLIHLDSLRFMVRERLKNTA